MSERVTLMYNAGVRITDLIIHNLPADKDSNYTNHWRLDAPKDDFFNVPEVVQVLGVQVSVYFVTTILRRYSDRGVICVDPAFSPPLLPDGKTIDKENDIQPYAQTKALAIAKGKENWAVYYMKIARSHVEQCQACRAANMPPVPASGFTKLALELAGITDPADAFILAQRDRNREAAANADKLNALMDNPARFKKLMELLDKVEVGGKSA